MTDDLRSVVADVEREMRADMGEFSDSFSSEDRWWARRCKRWADRLRDALEAEHVHDCVSEVLHEGPCVCSCGKELRA